MVDDSDSRRRAELAAEVLTRRNDGWHIVDGAEFEVTLMHVVTPRWWRAALDALLTLSVAGVPPSRERYLNIRSIEPGLLHRATIGDLPLGWKRRESWEVPDGPAPG